MYLSLRSGSLGDKGDISRLGGGIRSSGRGGGGGLQKKKARKMLKPSMASASAPKTESRSAVVSAPQTAAKLQHTTSINQQPQQQLAGMTSSAPSICIYIFSSPYVLICVLHILSHTHTYYSFFHVCRQQSINRRDCLQRNRLHRTPCKAGRLLRAARRRQCAADRHSWRGEHVEPEIHAQPAVRRNHQVTQRRCAAHR
jgi:hypothetical protein